MLSICHVTHVFSTKRYFPKGEWMYHLSRRGHRVYIVSCKLPGQPSYEKIGSLRIFRLPARFLYRLRYPMIDPVKLAYFLRRMVSKYGVQAIHFKGIEWLTSAASLFTEGIPKALTIVGIPGVNWFYGTRVIDSIGFLYSHTIGRVLLGSVDKIVVRSKRIAVFLRRLGVPPKKIHVLVRGIDEDRFTNLDVNSLRATLRPALGFCEKDVVVLFVGRLEPMKGINYLLKIAQIIPRMNASVKFLIVGYGSLESLVRRAAHDNPNIRFLGFRRDVPQLMAISDILVLPSISEAFPLVIIEAGFVGLPVVTTDVGAIPDIIKDGETGIIVPRGDVDSLIEAILLLANDPNLRKEFSERHRREIMTKYRWERLIVDYERFFYDLAALH